MKICCMCKLELHESNFKTRTRATDGLQSQCIDCQKIYRRKHYEENRGKYIKKASVWRDGFQDWWKEYKKQFSCSRCSESHPACLHFHHVNDDKEACVSSLATKAMKQKLLKEIEKCIPLCANCHAKLHWDERQAKLT